MNDKQLEEYIKDKKAYHKKLAENEAVKREMRKLKAEFFVNDFLQSLRKNKEM